MMARLGPLLLGLICFSVFFAEGFLSAFDNTFKPSHYDVKRLSPRVQEAFGANPPNLYVLTYGTRLGSYECASFMYAHLLGYTFNVIDYWELQYNAHKRSCGYQHVNKAEGMLEIHRLALLDPTAVVFFIDTDVVLQLPPEVLMDRYLAKYLDKGMPEEGMMYVATEVFCYPDGPYCQYTWDFVPVEVRRRPNLFKKVGWDRPTFTNGGSHIGHATFYQHFYRSTLAKKIHNMRANTSRYHFHEGTAKFKQLIATDDQHLFAYGLMEAGIKFDRDFDRDIFACQSGATWRHYTWLPTFGLWTQWTHMVNSTDYMEFFENEEKTDVAKLLTPGTACSPDWPPRAIRDMARKYEGATMEERSEFIKDFLLEAVRQYPKTPVVFHFNGIIKDRYGYMFKRWLQSSFHALRAAYEFANSGVWPYEVKSTAMGPDGPFVKACPGVDDLTEGPYTPQGSVRVGMKLEGVDLQLSNLCKRTDKTLLATAFERVG